MFLDEAFQQPAAPQQVASSEVPRTAAQQPAAFHEDPEMERLAREAVASLPEMPEVAEVPIEIPGIPGEPRLAALPAALPVGLPNGLPASPLPRELTSARTPADDLLGGIPFDSRRGAGMPYEYTAGNYGNQYSGGYRGGSAFGDLKTFFTMFGIFAVVFALLPRERH